MSMCPGGVPPTHGDDSDGWIHPVPILIFLVVLYIAVLFAEVYYTGGINVGVQ